MRCARGFKLAPLRRLAGPAPRAPSAPALRPAGPAGGHGPGDPPACRPIRARPRPRSESPPDARGGVGGGGGGGSQCHGFHSLADLPRPVGTPASPQTPPGASLGPVLPPSQLRSGPRIRPGLGGESEPGRRRLRRGPARSSPRGPWLATCRRCRASGAPKDAVPGRRRPSSPAGCVWMMNACAGLCGPCGAARRSGLRTDRTAGPPARAGGGPARGPHLGGAEQSSGVIPQRWRQLINTVRLLGSLIKS